MGERITTLMPGKVVHRDHKMLNSNLRWIKKGISSIIGERNYLLARAFFRTYPIMGKRPNVFLHTMGKVGSSTIFRFLTDTNLDNDFSIFRTTWVSREGVRFLENMENDGFGGWERYPPNVKAMITSCYVEHKLLQGIDKFKVKPLVITLIRDPIAINVSNFFHNYRWWPAELLEKSQNRESNYLEDLEHRFLDHNPHEMPLIWYDAELKEVFHVDVLSSEFPTDKGYKIYEGNLSDVLLIRLESLDKCVENALKEFLGVDEVTLVNTNVAQQKWYGTIYKEFIETIVLPDNYLNSMYDWNYAQHFYSEDEIAMFRAKWGKQATSSSG